MSYIMPDPTETFEAPTKEVRLDRSALENYAGCPFMAHAIETGKVKDNSIFALSGTEAHDAMGSIVHNFLNGHGAGPAEMAADAWALARTTNPLVSPDVLKAIGPSLYKFARFIAYREDGKRRNPADVLRHQGGTGEASGQLAAKIAPTNKPGLVYLLTSEVDLLLAGWNEKWLCEIDWKTGHGFYSATSIRESFQFQMHAWLLSEVYPGLEGVSVQVWNTRIGQATPWVNFTREDFRDFRARAMRCLIEREEAFAGKPGTNPFVETCSTCPATGICPSAFAPSAELAAAPDVFLAETVALEAALDARKKALYSYCRKNGPLTAAGVTCGQKPPSTRKPSMTIYSQRGADDADVD